MEFIINKFNLNVDIEFVTNCNHNDNLQILCTALMERKFEPDYEKLAVILVIKKQWESVFQENFEDLMENLFELNNTNIIKSMMINYHKLFDAGVVSEDFIKSLNKHKYNIIEHTNFLDDFNFDYMSLISLNNSYFLNLMNEVNGHTKTFESEVLESPQLMYWRIALQIHSTNEVDYDLFSNNDEKEWNNIHNTYLMLKTKKILHSSPTLFNSGTVKNQLSSCFLKFLEDDSIQGIFDTKTQCALISQHAGGIGLCLSSLRSKYSIIHSTQKHTQGAIALLDQYELLINYVNQSGRRSGAMAAYFEMTHPEIDDIINSAKHFNKLKIGLWIPDIFMERVKDNNYYSLFDGQYHRDLIELYGEEYRDLYLKYESEGYYTRQVSALDLYNLILSIQVERGHPFMCYKDTANLLSNQNNIGTIKSSNLCTEIFEVTDETTTAVCNLANLNLEDCVEHKTLSEMRILPKDTLSYKCPYKVNYKEIGHRTKNLVRNLNKIIDKNYYCCKFSKNTNFDTRPIGIGVTGYQGLFFKLMMSITSPEAREINKLIFETMYYYALRESNKISMENTNIIFQKCMDIPLLNTICQRYTGKYKHFEGSNLSKGLTHIDLYEQLTDRKVFTNYSWSTLKINIKKYGVVNSLFIALMPSVKTSVLTNSTESFEPLESMLINRNTQDGLFNKLNKYVKVLLESKNEYSQENINNIIKNNGSVQYLDCLSDEEKLVFRNVWEIPTKDYIDLCIDRAPFIDQSQSMNLYIAGEVNLENLGKLHMYSWKNRLKTGCYYMTCLNTEKLLNKQDVEINKTVDCSDCSGCS
jgi:ribonucleoside-diphosphate reductase alpha chain